MSATQPTIPMLGAEAAVPWAGLPLILVLAGVGLVALWGLSRFRPSMVSSMVPKAGADRMRTSPGRAPGELAEFATELEELAERLAARVDEKAAHLERLIAEADARLAALAGRPTPTVAPAVHEAPSPVPPAHSHEAKPAPARFVAARDLEPDPLTREIFRLADEGSSPVEIARRLDEQIGKVQLILALRAT
jgi:hypothetical protein